MEKKTTNKLLVISASIFILTITLLLITLFLKSRTKGTIQSRNQVSSGQFLPTIGGELTISNQKAGSKFIINQAKLANPGYIVIHKDNQGNPGEIVAKSNLLQRGEYANFEIQLKNPTQKTENYFVIIYYDNGNGYFDYPGLDVPAQKSTYDTVISKVTII